ncbi:UDP-N-acetylmuramoyl-tripeptide--D-alanyl-D-alanine ligase [Candidatus Sumerlaeota bacterium]|nr:UDP-N-acetylmuramoyl-tripeptide--D-alanyl-D-alanine ligase [Candidatus Sumerlaeota bacterium]
MNFTLSEIAQATAGRLVQGDPKMRAGRICTDTRTLRAGETFLALNGKNFAGDNFINDAIAKGATGIIASMHYPEKDFPQGVFLIKVFDTTEALGAIAREWRKVVDPTVVAITGSAGKTTTKEMLSFVCRGTFSLLATEGNLNNLVGLPQTLNRLREEHEVAIVETGMSEPGELSKLAGICIPDIAVITNIGNAHIGNFGTIEGLIAAKAELFEASPRTATAIINADCPHASIMAEAFDIPELVISYGQNPKADVRASNVELVAPYGYTFDLRILDVTQHIHLKVYGRYQISNALAAAAAAAAIGVPPEVIAQRLNEFDAPKMRAQTEWFDGFLLIADCYNASPDAMLTSLHSLNDLTITGQRYALLADMLELGDHTEKFHRDAGRAAAEAKVDFLCTIGTHSRFMREEAENLGVAARHFDSAEDAAEFLSRKLQSNDVLLVKGSRGMKLETGLLKLKEIRAAVRNGEQAASLTESQN